MTKILIAEDERDIRDLISFTLRFAGYEVATAANGEEAVEVTREELPDLVIMDVRMPKMSGYEACRIIKQEPDTRHIPVVFLSAKGQDAEVRAGMDSGAEEYILKPFSPDQLVERIKLVLNQVQK